MVWQVPQLAACVIVYAWLLAPRPQVSFGFGGRVVVVRGTPQESAGSSAGATAVAGELNGSLRAG